MAAGSVPAKAAVRGYPPPGARYSWRIVRCDTPKLRAMLLLADKIWTAYRHLSADLKDWT